MAPSAPPPPPPPPPSPHSYTSTEPSRSASNIYSDMTLDARFLHRGAMDTSYMQTYALRGSLSLYIGLTRPPHR